MSMHQISATLSEWEAPDFLVEPAEPGLLPGIVKLANAYPYPHTILGRAGAERYVQKLAAQTNYPGEGWYAATHFGEVVAATYLSVYGVGDGSSHTLWKIRHPLVADTTPAQSFLSSLFDAMTAAALRSRRGSAKFVMFLGEYETDVMAQARRAGFQCEARFKDYYRLGEDCLVYCKTVR